MITKRFTRHRTKSLREDKTLRDHAGTAEAVYVLNQEISLFDTLPSHRAGQPIPDHDPANPQSNDLCKLGSPSGWPGVVSAAVAGYREYVRQVAGWTSAANAG